MGAIADALMAYAQPLLEGTDGSQEEMQKALDMTMMCYNLALAPGDQREEVLAKFRAESGMSERQFAEFRSGLIDPMIRRHEQMFPALHNRAFSGAMAARPSIPELAPGQPRPGDPYPGTDRYAPCPCGSGEKYKFCCGKKGR